MKKITVRQQKQINGGTTYRCNKKGPNRERCQHTTSWCVL